VELYLHSLNTPSWCGAQVKHRTNFYLYQDKISYGFEAFNNMDENADTMYM